MFTAGLGQECKRDSECLDSSDPKQRIVWCYNKQCACRNGFKRDGTRCGKLQTTYVICSHHHASIRVGKDTTNQMSQIN